MKRSRKKSMLPVIISVMITRAISGRRSNLSLNKSFRSGSGSAWFFLHRNVVLGDGVERRTPIGGRSRSRCGQSSSFPAPVTALVRRPRSREGTCLLRRRWRSLRRRPVGITAAVDEFQKEKLHVVN